MKLSTLFSKENRKTTTIGLLIGVNTVATLFGVGLPPDVFNGVMTSVGLAVASDGS